MKPLPSSCMEASETVPDMTDATLNIQDRVSTLYRGTNHWSIAGKGQSGRTDGDH